MTTIRWVRGAMVRIFGLSVINISDKYQW